MEILRRHEKVKVIRRIYEQKIRKGIFKGIKEKIATFILTIKVIILN